MMEEVSEEHAPPNREAPSAAVDASKEVTKTLIKAAATVIVAGLGLLGPLTTAIVKLQELRLDEQKFALQLRVEQEKNKGAKEIQEATLRHQTEMDFLSKLIDLPGFQADLEKTTIYRRDVLKFFKSTLSNGALGAFAESELKAAEGELAELRGLKAASEEAQRAAAELKKQLEESQKASGAQRSQLLGQIKAAEERARDANERLLAKTMPTVPAIPNPLTIAQVTKLDAAIAERDAAECSKCVTDACKKAWCRAAR